MPDVRDPKEAMTDTERLAEIHFMVRDMWRQVHGNGTPGLLDRVKTLEVRFWVGAGLLVAVLPVNYVLGLGG